jgi:hypothetical protein
MVKKQEILLDSAVNEKRKNPIVKLEVVDYSTEAPTEPKKKIIKKKKIKSNLMKRCRYLKQRQELRSILGMETELLSLMKKNKSDPFTLEDPLKDTKRRLNNLQKIKQEYIAVEKTPEEGFKCQYLQVNQPSEIKLGSSHQALIPGLQDKQTQTNSRRVVCVWNPEKILIEGKDKFFLEVQELLGVKEVAEEKVLKLLIRCANDKAQVLNSIRKNKTYYRNILCPALKKFTNELKKLC